MIDIFIFVKLCNLESKHLLQVNLLSRDNCAWVRSSDLNGCEDLIKQYIEGMLMKNKTSIESATPQGLYFIWPQDASSLWRKIWRPVWLQV